MLVECAIEKPKLILDLTVYGTLLQNRLTVDELRECVKAEYLEGMQRNLHNKPVHLSSLVTPEFIIQYQQELELAFDEEELDLTCDGDDFDEYLIQEGSYDDVEIFDGNIKEIEEIFGTTKEEEYVPMNVSEEENLTSTDDKEVIQGIEHCEESDFSSITPITSSSTTLTPIVFSGGEQPDEFDMAMEFPEDESFEDCVATEYFEDVNYELSSDEDYVVEQGFNEDLVEDSFITEPDTEFEVEDNEIEDYAEPTSDEDDDYDWDEESSDMSDTDDIADEDEDEFDLFEDEEEDDEFDSTDDEDDCFEEEFEEDLTLVGDAIEENVDYFEEEGSDTQEDNFFVDSTPITSKSVIERSAVQKQRQEKQGTEHKQRQVHGDDFDKLVMSVPKPVIQKPQTVEKQVTINRSAEPTDIRAFVRAHPHCSHAELTQYFTIKAIQKAVLLGKIIKKGNTYQI